MNIKFYCCSFTTVLRVRPIKCITYDRLKTITCAEDLNSHSSQSQQEQFQHCFPKKKKKRFFLNETLPGRDASPSSVTENHTEICTVFCPRILGMLFGQMVFIFTLAFYIGQIQMIVPAESPTLLSVSLTAYCIIAFEGPFFYLAQYFLPEVSSCRLSL